MPIVVDAKCTQRGRGGRARKYRPPPLHFGYGKSNPMTFVPQFPVLLDIANKTAGWLPRILFGAVAFPTDFPIMDALVNFVIQNFLDDEVVGLR